MVRSVALRPGSSLLVLVGLTTAVALAQSGDQDHAAPKGDTSVSSRSYAAAYARMQQDMDITYTGNADVDFARSMIAHHRGGLEVARVLLMHGTDPDLKKMAETMSAAQEAELVFLRAWLQKMGR